MKFLIVLAIVAAASADVSHITGGADYAAPIIKSVFDNTAESFRFAYETGNGIVAQAEGAIKNPNAEYPSLEVKGAYSYTSPDGTPIQVSYVADENGYQPQGAHLPVGPEIPEYITRSLAYNAAHAPVEGARLVGKAAAFNALLG